MKLAAPLSCFAVSLRRSADSLERKRKETEKLKAD